MSPTAKRPIRYNICVSGSHSGTVVRESYALAERLGAAIAKSGQVLTTGATVGLPYYAAQSAKKAGGFSVGFSPAASLREHLRKYRLPYDCYDFVNFTGLHYVGRDLYLVQSSDAVIVVGGSFGTLHEFTSALEAGKPCGILIDSDGTANVIPKLMEILDPPDNELVIYDKDPERLVARIIELIDKKYKDIHEELLSRDEHWFMRRNSESQHHG